MDCDDGGDEEVCCKVSTCPEGSIFGHAVRETTNRSSSVCAVTQAIIRVGGVSYG